ncbi:MAG: hypothetical protein COA96_12730 [SAR86 cluster bacterium]|uniref:DUF454 domain-containing protein n=1 Tax=SAR86 cluster bacterium TaxID=2030880 RepID=A0A2A5AV99_9GAMM|nr:MAG: hypothetical protein COA96_12730 [SAR86 cluster bacterium]
MNYSRIAAPEMSFFYKALCIVLIACCVLIGLVGLVLPIIPGFLFLFFAAILLARVSSRFKDFLHSNSNTKAWLKRWQSTKALSLPQRIKLSFWVAAKSIVSSAEYGVNFLKTRLKNR